MFRIHYMCVYVCVLGAGGGAERRGAWRFEAGSESTALLPVQRSVGPGHYQGWILCQTGSCGTYKHTHTRTHTHLAVCVSISVYVH